MNSNFQYQKQRPNVERVAACIRQHHPQYSNETVHQVGLSMRKLMVCVLMEKVKQNRCLHLESESETSVRVSPIFIIKR